MGFEGLAGIVIGHTDYGESDRIVRVLTADHGRISVLARSARSSRKRFAGLLDLGTRIRFGTTGRGLQRFVDVELVAPVHRARNDYDRIALLAYGCELVGRLAGEGLPAPRLARLLVVWLEVLEGEPLVDVPSRQSLEGKSLTFAGLLPPLTVCSVCGEPAEGGMVFGFESGPAHTECGAGTAVSAGALEQLEVLRRTPLFETVDGVASAAGWLLSDHAQYQLGGPLRSRSMFV